MKRDKTRNFPEHKVLKQDGRFINSHFENKKYGTKRAV